MLPITTINLISIAVILVIALIAHQRWVIYFTRRDLAASIAACGHLKDELDAMTRRSQLLASRLDTSLSHENTLSDRLYTQNNTLRMLLGESFSTLNALGEEYFDKRNLPVVKSAILRRFEEELTHIQSSDTLNKIRAAVDSCQDNIITRLRLQMPRFKESDINFLSLIAAGLAPRTVALILGLTLGNYYNKWTRLRARISASSSPDRDDFLNIFLRSATAS